MNPLVLDGATTVGTRESWATLSPCGLYRYALGRTWDPAPEGEWDPQRPVFSIIMLNPSTADHDLDDPTIRRCIHFAKQEGCGALLVRNLFAFRATDPRELLAAADPVGPLNAKALSLGLLFAVRVAAWGALSSARLRRLAKPSWVQARCTHRMALGATKSGEPRHPLYLPNTARAATRQA